MSHQPGTKIRVTKIQEKDFFFVDFEATAILLNGREGVISKHYEAIEEFGEREAYLVDIDTDEGVQSYELESDEFELI
ncbi:hypothetical protein AC739_19520 [Planococcus glaciei]|uniref:hypothetical protein n=1 Tax=Planococcus glaciei TaxID=459472 RepID=UPI00069D391F|nr:hypothetical protein [Planococcus glaciei]KOF08180.1 hypothetical protein AC739_19520 [Planococcus glaciei]